MEIFLRIIAIIIEVLILAVIAYAILNGVRLSALDLGIGKKYHRMLTLVLVVIGVIVLFFFIAHLTTFYPTIG